MHRVLAATNPCRKEKEPGVAPSKSFSVAMHNPTAHKAAKMLVYNIHFKKDKRKEFD
jgi:hypothetical protein